MEPVYSLSFSVFLMLPVCGEILLNLKYEECRLLGCYEVSLVRADFSEELSASIIRVTRID
jgi:hypothetical protein